MGSVNLQSVMCRILNMKSLSYRTIIVSLFLSGIISFGVGYSYFTSTQSIPEPLTIGLRHKNVPKRLDSVKAVSSENIKLTKNLLFDRLLDSNHYIKATTAEKCYRMGLSRDIPAETLAKIVSGIEDDTELSKRWLIANVIAIDFESGFEMFSRELGGLTSPFSRMLLVQLLTIHSKNDNRAKLFIEEKCKSKGAERAIARMVRRMLKTDRSRWFKGFFPPDLIIKEVPEKGKPARIPGQVTQLPLRKKPRQP